MKQAFAGGVPRRAAFVALIVGTILNAINQGDALVTGRPLDWFKLVLTFLVPYCVFDPWRRDRQACGAIALS